jgi:hypothetical protein
MDSRAAPRDNADVADRDAQDANIGVAAPCDGEVVARDVRWSQAETRGWSHEIALRIVRGRER